MEAVPFLTAQDIDALHDYDGLVTALGEAFAENAATVPLRNHFTYNEANTLLLMPAWQNGRDIGIKLVTVTPDNPTRRMPSIQGIVVYFDAKTGSPLAMMDAAEITKKRTAAASALASTFLSRKDSTRLLMLGTGNLAPELIYAHCAVRPISEVYIWGRNWQKAKQLANKLNLEGVTLAAVEDIEDIATTCDIISAATMTEQPILTATHLHPGQHLDLVGSYRPDMREADDSVITAAKIYVDIMEGATKESGDIYQPLQTGVILQDDIKGELKDLCAQTCEGRQSADEITLFKSVGYALEDLVAARYYYDRFMN